MQYYLKDVIFMLCPEGEEKMGEVENILEIKAENPQIGKKTETHRFKDRKLKNIVHQQAITYFYRTLHKETT